MCSSDLHTAHTLLDVPVIVVNAGKLALNNGRLADVAPTLLDLAGIAKPAQMTGQSLIAAEREIRKAGSAR